MMNETEMKALWMEEQMVKKVGSRIKFRNQAIQNTVERIAYRFKEIATYDDVISLALEHATSTVFSFDIRGEKNIEDLLAGDKELNGKLNKNINLVLKNRLQHIDDKAFYTFENATKRHVVIKPVVASLDMTVTDAIGNEMVLAETIDKGFWELEEGYVKSFFIEWFLKEHKNFLTTKQVQFVNDFINGKEAKRKSGFIERIRERSFKEFKDTYGIELLEKQPNHLERQINSKLGLWNGLISIVEDDSDLANQNTKLSNWFIKNINKEEVSNLISDKLNGKETRRILYAISCRDLGVEIPAKVLYKLVKHVYDRVEQLNNTDTTCTPFYKTEREIANQGGWTKESQSLYREKTKKLNHSNTFVYDSQGTFKEAIPYKPFKSTKTIIQTLTPTGATVVEEA